MKLNEDRTADLRLSRVYRVGAGSTGVLLLVFGTLGFLNRLDFFDTPGQETLGLSNAFNLQASRMPNVIFSFIAGSLVMTFGMYGRVSGGLPHDNPYWRRRHPGRKTAESLVTARPGGD